MNNHESRASERSTEIIDRVLDGKGFDLHAFDISPVMAELKNHEFRTFVLDRVKANIGIDDVDIGEKLCVNTDILLDEMLIWMINSFEQCWVTYRLQLLSSEERTWLATAVPAMKAANLLYDILVIPDSASGRFVRMQRVGTTLYLVYPN